MYKVLLVDDERIILEGISKIIDWASIGTVLAGTARNGIEAYQLIEREQPDIVISDIKMPGLDGLQLVAKVHETFPNIRFILLSGFSEFDYARTAMQYGVKHYLLKPCNELRIIEALQELTEEIRQSEQKERFLDNMKEQLEKVLPYTKEQLLKEFVTNKTYGNRDLEHYEKWFHLHLNHPKVRLILFQLEGEFDFEHMFAMKNIAQEVLESPILSTTIGEYILIIVEDIREPEEWHERIQSIRDLFFQYYQMDATTALSEADEIRHAKRLYKESLECLNHRFYLGEGSLITKKDIVHTHSMESVEFTYDEQKLCLLVKSGRWEDAQGEMETFFSQLAQMRLATHITRSYVIQLFVSVIRLCDPEKMNSYLEKMPILIELDTLQGMQGFLENVVKEITKENYDQNKHRHSTVINKVIEIIHEHLGDPNLSLNWVASQMLYMNADYLGKLFKKETGDKFSNYVTKIRIEKAIERIEREEDLKIFELAEMLGFGDNPQYFSQVFKKYTGCTPSEYRKVP